MVSGPSTQTGGASPPQQQTRRERRAERARAHRAKTLAERIEATSRKCVAARSEGRANDAHMADVELLGDDAGQAPRYAPTKRPDPYLVSHGGLFETKRAGGGKV
jgi:hypothetical protein